MRSRSERSAMKIRIWKVMGRAVWLVALMAWTAASASHGPASQRTESGALAEIRKLLAEQQAAWNRGDQDEFLLGYWNSDETAFAGTQGIVRGWRGLRERYRKGYPDRAAMGRLEFSDLEVTPLCSEAALALGKWHLEREAGPIGGVFSLVLRRFPEGWRIVADHTSVVPAAAPAGKP